MNKSRETFLKGLWEDNPVFRMMLGICITLAVTNMVSNGITMGIAVFFVLTCSSVIVSLIRDYIPRRARIPVFMLIIATFVIIVDQFLKAYFISLSNALGPYVGLIITNCIILGRLESFASGNDPWSAFLDAAGVGLGFAGVLIAISFVREILGFGTVLGYPALGGGWEPWVTMILPPGGFFVLGIFIWIHRSITPVEEG